jgi:hypothetical protein
VIIGNKNQPWWIPLLPKKNCIMLNECEQRFTPKPFVHLQYTPSVSTIILSGPTYSSQNVRQIWESTLSKSDYLVGHFGLGRTFWSDVRVDIKRFFFTFLEVKISNILWSMRICKRTFFPVCRMCGYVNTLVYFYLAPYSRQER